MSPADVELVSRLVEQLCDPVTVFFLMPDRLVPCRVFTAALAFDMDGEPFLLPAGWDGHSGDTRLVGKHIGGQGRDRRDQSPGLQQSSA